MKLSLTNDMTCGSETGHIIRFAVPMLAGNLLQQLYNLADTVVVGKFIGDDALAAVGATGSVTYFFYTLCLGLAVGAGVIISQYFGAGMKSKSKSAIFNSGILTLAIGIAVSIASVLLTKPVLVLLGVEDRLLEAAVGYMKIACGGTIAVAAYNWINAVMRSLGDSRTPLVFLCAASVMNVALDMIFVLVFKLGVNGAAAATVISQGAAALASIIYAFWKNENISLTKEDMHVEPEMMGRCIKTGIPISLQNGLIALSMMALQRVTNSFGATIMAAYTVSMRIEQLVQQPFCSLNMALSTFVGQNIGAGKSERAVNGYKVGIKISSVFALVVMVLFFIFGKQLVGCFVSGAETISVGAAALKITSCFYVSLGAIHVTRGFLNGAGDTGYALFNGLVEVICRVVFSLILTNIVFIGSWGIWITTCITWLATGAFSVIRYKTGKWKEKDVISS